ncbi:MAG TPA: SIS domain-containing protein [Terriglobales bacterium]|jgi:D-sedoheptulose 7-phosphate isomerase
MLSPLNLESVFSEAITGHLDVIHQLDSQRQHLEEVASRMTQAVLEGHKILWCGNGGSASDAQHLAAELVGRYRRDRPGLASISLTANAAAVIGIANDFGFHEVFARQVEALCTPGDVFVGISTSGNSRNVLVAQTRAREMGAFTVAITGEHGGRLGSSADVWVRIPSRDTARIQEAYMLCGHMLCDWVELATCIAHAVEAQRTAG